MFLQVATELQSYRQATKRNQIHQPGEQHPESWEAPLPGLFKVNVDGATVADEDAFKVGAIIRDCTGSFVAAIIKKFKGLIDVLRANQWG